MTYKIVGYDEKGKDLWVCYPELMWFTKSFSTILKEHLNLELNDENVKQLQDLYEGDTERLWNLHSLCRDCNDHNYAVNAHLLYPDLPIKLLKQFMAKFPKIPGSAFKSLLFEFANHRCIDQVEYVVKDTSSFQTIIDTKLEENRDKIVASPDKEKVANWLVGQVMKEIKDKSTVNVQELKKEIHECVQRIE